MLCYIFIKMMKKYGEKINDTKRVKKKDRFLKRNKVEIVSENKREKTKESK